MSGAHDFIAELARASKGYKEIKETVDAAFGDKTLQKKAIYDIIKEVKAGKDTADQRHLNLKKTVRTATLIASVATAVEEDWRVTIETLGAAHGASLHNIQRILPEDLGLEKKTARWVPRLLSPEQKEERVGPALNSSPPSSATPWR
jgi:histone-lysine N-methyltransferase SETMAR